MSETFALRQPNGYLPAIVCALVVAPALLWLASLGDVSIYFLYETPPGQVYYIASKLAGLYSVVFLWLQVILALLRGALPPTIVRANVHRRLGLTVILLTVSHALLFAAAVSARKGHLALGVFLPSFNSGFFDAAVALGVLAFYGVFGVIITGFLRRYMIVWPRWVHRLAMPALMLALVHGLLIGSETRQITTMLFYVAMITLFFAALCYRYGRVLRPRPCTTGA